MAEKKIEIKLSPVKLEAMAIEIEGLTPLLMNRFSDIEKEKILAKQVKKTKEKKARDIEEEISEKIHRLPDGTIGFPSLGFKKAMTEAAPYLTGMNKKLARGAFYVLGDMVPIQFKEQKINTTRVKIAGGITTIRFRPEFDSWSCVLNIRYNANQISPEQIVNLANVAGFHIGVGDWTPQHNGQYGMFQVRAHGRKEDI